MGTFLTKGTQFTTGDTVTASGLNNLVDNATVTAGSIGSTELGVNSVTADKISTVSPQPVTTSTIRDNAVDNTKLNNMGSQTVKVNDTNGSADPTDLGMIGGGTNGSSKILMGTSNSLSVLTATQFKMVDASDVDATDSTATKLELNTTAISDWDTVALATDVDTDADRILIWDYDPLSLKQISPTKLIQSLPALTTTSGVVRLATQERAIDPSTASTVDADVLTVNQSASMLAKAWARLTYNKAGTEDDGTLTVNASFNLDAPTYSFTSNRGLVTFPITTDLDSSVTDYCVIVNAAYVDGSDLKACVCDVTSDSNTSFVVQFRKYSGALINPANINLVIFA